MSGRRSLSELPRGHDLGQAQFTVTRELLTRYLGAVGDRNAVYAERALVPPVALVAFALGQLLERVDLPQGTLHTSQEIEVRRGVPLGAQVTMHGRVVQRSERAGLVLSVLEYDLMLDGADEPAIVGRTTVAAPASGSGGGA
jgi:hypothetical protein